MKSVLQGVHILRFILLLALLPGVAAAKVSFHIEYTDAAGSGFYSQESRSPIGGNSGTTLGQQRQIAFEKSLETFESSFTSTVPIHIQARFESKGGTAYSATLASAGPEWFNFNFPGAPLQNIAYPSALANKISGLDLSDASRGIADIEVLINSDVDGTALGSSIFYYGLDGQGLKSDLDFMTVISHEILHGLGFLSVIDPLTGHKFGCGSSSCSTNNIGDVFSNQLARVVDNQPVPLLSMDQSTRLAAATATNEVVWVGTAAEEESSSLFNGTIQNWPKIYAPSPAALGSSLSHTDFSLIPTALMQAAYSGPTSVSPINLAMLADIGWGTAADLEVSLAASDESAHIFTVTLANNKSETLTKIILELSASAGYLSLRENKICTRPVSSSLRCEIGSIASQQILSFDVEITSISGDINMTAFANGNGVDLYPENNRDSIQARLESAFETPASIDPAADTTSTETSVSETPTASQSMDSAPPLKVSQGGGSNSVFFTGLLLMLLAGRQCQKLKKVPDSISIFKL